MSITVKYFASLRERLGRSEDQLELPGDDSTVAEIWQRVSESEPEMPDNILTAINMEYVKPEARVKDGDEVAFFPPVTGG